MTSNGNQSQRIYDKATRTWYEVPEDQYKEFDRWRTNLRKREQYWGRCFCPRGKWWLCDGNCVECEFHTRNEVSLDDPLPDGEVMLTLLASFAQSESESISTNVKWGIRKRMQAGIPYANGHMNVYGYRWEGDEMVIVPEEAAIVRRIYQNFLDGKSRQETEKEFAAEGIKTRGGYRWVDSNLKLILTNVTYTGNMLYQKEYVSDPITGKVKKNHGELPRNTTWRTRIPPSSTKRHSTMYRLRWHGAGSSAALATKRSRSTASPRKSNADCADGASSVPQEQTAQR